jgi:lysophospholipid acyltransferase (LPLAT)-like uncharacterized protein
MLAQKTGHSILPATYSARKMKVFSSWDRFILPHPFSRCRMIFGKPITVPEKADHISRENCRTALESELNRITNAADGYFGHRIK